MAYIKYKPSELEETLKDIAAPGIAVDVTFGLKIK
jgi:hypothetical protein